MKKLFFSLSHFFNTSLLILRLVSSLETKIIFLNQEEVPLKKYILSVMFLAKFLEIKPFCVTNRFQGLCASAYFSLDPIPSSAQQVYDFRMSIWCLHCAARFCQFPLNSILFIVPNSPYLWPFLILGVHNESSHLTF